MKERPRESEKSTKLFNESHVTLWEENGDPHIHTRYKTRKLLLTSHPTPCLSISNSLFLPLQPNDVANNTIGSRGGGEAAKTERDTLPFINRHSLTDRMAVVVNYPHSSSNVK